MSGTRDMCDVRRVSVMTTNGLLSCYHWNTWINPNRRGCPVSPSLSPCLRFSDNDDNCGRLTCDANAPQTFLESFANSTQIYVLISFASTGITRGMSAFVRCCFPFATTFRLMTYIDVQCDRAHRVQRLHNNKTRCVYWENGNSSSLNREITRFQCRFFVRPPCALHIEQLKISFEFPSTSIPFVPSIVVLKSVGNQFKIEMTRGGDKWHPISWRTISCLELLFHF